MHCGWVFHIFGSLFCWGGGVVGEVGGKLITYPSLGKTNSLTNYFSSVWLTRENRKENIEQNILSFVWFNRGSSLYFYNSIYNHAQSKIN